MQLRAQQRMQQRAQQLRWGSKKVVARHLHLSEYILWTPPGALLLFTFDSAAGVLRSVPRSVPRPNYYLPALTELEDEASDVDSLAS